MPVSELRSSIMRAVKSRDTSPELTVRKLLYSIAPSYRLHRSDLPGKPDIAYVGRQKAIFVHGCFWHGHDCPRGARIPKNNRDYWVAKIARNRARDQKAQADLQDFGWKTFVIWECQLKQPQRVAQRLRRFLQV